MNGCTTEGCPRPVAYKTAALCAPCYKAQWHQARKPPPEPKVTKVAALCSAADCDLRAHAKGLCQKHYQASKKHRPDATKCAEPGCAENVYAKGLCLNHRNAQLFAVPERRAKRRARQAEARAAMTEEDREAKRQYDAAYHAANRDRLLAGMTARYADNREEHLAVTNAWKKDNPVKVKASNQARRALKKGAEGRWTDEEWQAILAEHDHKCSLCDSPDNLTVEHIIALNDGGTNWPWNLSPLCLSCNCSKQDRFVAAWRKGELVFAIW